MSDTDGDRLIGSLGLVTIQIFANQRPGEVQLVLRGSSESFIAYAAEPIQAGEQVLVVGRRPGRIVDVIRFTE